MLSPPAPAATGRVREGTVRESDRDAGATGDAGPFVGARLVLPDGVRCGSLAVAGGVIRAIEAGEAARRGSAGGVDCAGDFLLPGLIDLHTDGLEKHYQPRAGVTWDPVAAALAHDAQVAACGITTVYDALTVGAHEGWDVRAEMIAPMLEGLSTASANGMLRAEHKVHLRCECTHPDIVDVFERHAAGLEASGSAVAMLSLMDHAPGDRQSPDMEAYKRRYRGMLGCEGRVERHVQALLHGSKVLAPGNRRELAAIASSRRLPLATHDDARPEHVEEAAELGAAFSEFPTTLAAARRAKDLGIPNMMGSPNLLRGGSHSGNVSAAELANHGLLDLLGSDYIPASLLQAVFRLTSEPFGWPLHEAVNVASLNPAHAAGLDDRGALEAGRRADLVRVRVVEGRPVVKGVWVAGERVA